MVKRAYTECYSAAIDAWSTTGVWAENAREAAKRAATRYCYTQNAWLGVPLNVLIISQSGERTRWMVKVRMQATTCREVTDGG